MGNLCSTSLAFVCEKQEPLKEFYDCIHNTIRSCLYNEGRTANGADLFYGMGLSEEIIAKKCWTRSSVSEMCEIEKSKEEKYFFVLYCEENGMPYAEAWINAIAESKWADAGITVYCRAEVEGEACYNTDPTGIYFPEKYYIDSYGIAEDEDDCYEQYLSSEEDVFEWFRKAGITGTTLEDCIAEATARAKNSTGSDTFFEFREYVKALPDIYVTG